MRLTYICGFAWEPKGTVRARAFPMAEEMVRRGHEVTLICAPYDNRNYSGKEFVNNGVSVVNIEIKSGMISAALIPYDLVKAVNESKPDLVHVFKPKGFAGLAATWLLSRNKNVVLDCDDWEGWGGWNDVKDYPWVTKEFIHFQEKSLIRRSRAITVASRTLLQRALSSGKAAEQVFYAPNGPTTELLQLSELLLQGNSWVWKERLGLGEAPILFYASHFDPADDLTFFCRSVARLAASEHITLVLVGDGPEGHTVRSSLANVPNLSVRFLGSLPFEQYAQVLAAADVCAFPYPDSPVYRAKCSARIIDYMLFGKAVVTTAVGQNPEYIVNGASGLLTRPGEEDHFAQALSRLLADADLRRQLGVNARARILQNFLWSGKAGDNCERAYYSLLPKKEAEPVTLVAS